MEKQFLIVGQGIAGSLLAYGMYKAGMNFKIVSTPELSKASEIALGMYSPLVFKRLTKAWMVDECLPVMHQTFQELECELGGRFLYPMDILKPLAADEVDLWRKRREEQNFSDYIAEIGLNGLNPGIKDFQNYARITNSGYVNLGKLLKKLRKFFKEKGLLINSHFRYKDLGFIGTQITWHGLSTKTIVFCEGFRAMENPYFKCVGFRPTKGELIEVECKALSQDYIINKNLFVMPVGNHRFKVGATYNWNHVDEKRTDDAKMDLISRFDSLVELPYKVVDHWAGVRPTIVDRRPVLGIHPLHEHIAIFNGLGTKGVMLAPYFVREMVRFLSVSDYPLAPEVDIKRFL